jgi:hypothetical protein
MMFWSLQRILVYVLTQLVVTELNRRLVFGHRLRISLATFVFFFSGLLAWSAMQRSTQIVQ